MAQKQKIKEKLKTKKISAQKKWCRQKSVKAVWEEEVELQGIECEVVGESEVEELVTECG